MTGWDTARLDEIEDLPGPGTLRWTPVRRHFDVRAFGVNAYTATEAGQDVVEEHTEQSNGHEELYVVVAGHARFTLDGEAIDAPAGTLVFLRDPAVRRAAVALEAPTTVLALGGKPGLHEVSAWEYFFTAYGVVDQDPERAVAEIQAGLSEKPDHPALYYHLACIYARTGRLDEARTALGRALELDPELQKWVDEDEDLDPIRKSS